MAPSFGRAIGAVLHGDKADVLTSGALHAAVRAALAGPGNEHADSIVWRDRGAQILLDLASLQVHNSPALCVVAVDTETSEFGRLPLIARFVLAHPDASASLVAATDDTPLGDPRIAARWGELFRDVVWTALVRQVVVHAEAKGGQARGLRASAEGFHVDVDDRGISDLVEQHRHPWRRSRDHDTEVEIVVVEEAVKVEGAEGRDLEGDDES